jgi:hypothetical protein
MENAPPYLARGLPAHVFGAKAVRDGKIVRRSLRDIERYIGRERFVRGGAQARFPGGGERGPDGHLLQQRTRTDRPGHRFRRRKRFGKAGFSGPELPAIPLTSHLSDHTQP